MSAAAVTDNNEAFKAASALLRVVYNIQVPQLIRIKSNTPCTTQHTQSVFLYSGGGWACDTPHTPLNTALIIIFWNS